MGDELSIFFTAMRFIRTRDERGLFIYLLLYIFELKLFDITENDVMMKKGWSLLGVLSLMLPSFYIYLFFYRKQKVKLIELTCG